MNDGFGQWRDALAGVARLAGWQPRVAAASVSRADVVTGRGIAIGGFAGSQVGVVAEIEVNRRTGRSGERIFSGPGLRASPSTCRGSRTSSRAT